MPNEKSKPPLKLTQEPEAPDIYTDSVQLQSGVYGILINFGVLSGEPEKQKSEVVAKVRMSPQLALIFCQILRKQLKDYQKNVGKISLPKKLFEDLGIKEEL